MYILCTSLFMKIWPAYIQLFYFLILSPASLFDELRFLTNLLRFLDHWHYWIRTGVNFLLLTLSLHQWVQTLLLPFSLLVFIIRQLPSSLLPPQILRVFACRKVVGQFLEGCLVVARLFSESYRALTGLLCTVAVVKDDFEVSIII